MDAVARRFGASKATIYRRWPGKTALVVAAAAALFTPPEVPDTGDLREDLLACGRAYQCVAARGLLVVEEDVLRVVDNVLLPALRHG